MATHFAGPFFSALSLNSFNRFRWICMETTFDKKELKFLLKFMQMKEGRHIWLYRRKLQTPNSMLYLSLSLSLTLHNGTNLMARNFVILTRCFCNSGQCHNNKIKGRWFYYLFHYIEKINLMPVSIAPATLIYTHLQCRELNQFRMKLLQKIFFSAEKYCCSCLIQSEQLVMNYNLFSSLVLIWCD